MTSTIPQLNQRLPQLFDFVRTLARRIETAELRDGDELRRQLRDFYTVETMHDIEAVAPGWQAMAALADGATRNHITQVLVALQLLPEYRQASQDLQSLLEWTVLYHDLGKQVIAGQRDSLHAFRSATMAARTLPTMGFPASNEYATTLDPWTRLVLSASVPSPDGKGPIQDNRRLPEILQGIDRLFGADSGAGLIVQGILLHQSLNVVPEWPNPGSLADTEIPQCIRPQLLPLLEAMMLVDSDAWQLFDPESKARYRRSTLEVFVNVRRMVGG
jgi:hypothetical protein